MFKRILFYRGGLGSSGAGWSLLLMQGLLFVLFGLAVAIFPQLLVALIAAFFISIGLMLVFAALSMRSVNHSGRAGPPAFWP